MVNIEKAKSLKRYKSTKERRIATLHKGSPLNILPNGKSLTPFWFRGYNQIAFINMGVKQINMQIKERLSSFDGIPVEVFMQLNVKIEDEEEKIKRVISNYDGEEKMLINTLIRHLQLFIGNIKSVDIIREANNSTLYLTENAKKIENEINSSFKIINIMISQFKVVNKEITEIIEKTIKNREQELSNKEITKIKLEQHELEQKFKEVEAKGELEIERLKEQHTLEHEKERYEHELHVIAKKSEVLKTEGGRMTLHPKEMFSLLEKEIELKTSENRDKQEIIYSFFNQVIDSGNAYQIGQLNALKAMLERHYDIKLTDMPINEKNNTENKENLLGMSKNKNRAENNTVD